MPSLAGVQPAITSSQQPVQIAPLRAPSGAEGAAKASLNAQLSKIEKRLLQAEQFASSLPRQQNFGRKLVDCPRCTTNFQAFAQVNFEEKARISHGLIAHISNRSNRHPLENYLDVGAGMGHISLNIAEYFKSGVAVEPNTEHCKHLRKVLPSHVAVFEGRSKDYSSDTKFSLILLSHMLATHTLNVQEWKNKTSEFAKRLSPGGTLCCVLGGAGKDNAHFKKRFAEGKTLDPITLCLQEAWKLESGFKVESELQTNTIYAHFSSIQEVLIQYLFDGGKATGNELREYAETNLLTDYRLNNLPVYKFENVQRMLFVTKNAEE